MLWTCLLLVSLALANTQEEKKPLFHPKFDYKKTFKRPFFFKDKRDAIPYFKTAGTTVLTQDFVRLTSSIPLSQGTIWTEKPIPYKEWEVHFAFMVHGHPVGGTGLGFWYLKNVPSTGQFYGVSEDIQEGIGILLDSSDVNENRETPLIYGYSPKKQANTRKLALGNMLGSCFRDYRGTEKPVWIRITYYNKELHVYFDMQQGGYAYTECFNVKDLHLPENGYFGLSASTSEHLADDHDIIAFESYEINPPAKPHKDRPHEKEYIKKHGEYHMDKEMKDRIHKVEEFVKEQENQFEKKIHGDHHVLSSKDVDKFIETQFKIVEALDVVLQRLDIHSVKSKEPVASDLDRKLNLLADDVRELINIVNSLSHRNSINEQKNDHVMNNVLGHVTDLKSHVASSKSHVTSEHKHPLYYYLFAFSAGGLFMYAVSVVWRSGSQQPKKFI